MYEATLQKLYEEYCQLLSTDKIEAEEFKQIALVKYPHLELDIMLWT